MVKYDWKKTLVKGLWAAGAVIVSGLIVVWQDDPKYMALIPLLAMAQNWLKHR